MKDIEIIVKAFEERQTTDICQVKGTKCPLKQKDGKCKALLTNGKRCTGLIGIVINSVDGTLKDSWTNAEIPLETWQLIAMTKESHPIKELAKEK